MISLLSMQTFLGVDRIPDLHVLCNFLFVESGINEYFGSGIWNPGLLNPDYSSRNPEFH